MYVCVCVRVRSRTLTLLIQGIHCGMRSLSSHSTQQGSRGNGTSTLALRSDTRAQRQRLS